ncbi:ERI1 exoribonuclease 3-like protein [Euroglyphus maynei]|uniref:ERI1 exoribonuclease 3-like protein n=1 Tax=Euroglyphus maynei TaxID=6958 RepID=A0A1Y3BSF6_EURMA|nr:ERI1 exoribonuclease 3-like protein [Euroglyphus maynei]
MNGMAQFSRMFYESIRFFHSIRGEQQQQQIQTRPKEQQQNFDYFLILDFEATCDRPQLTPMEIIEFPVLKFDARTFEIVDKFHRYVRPTVNPNLTPFCIELTGIIQDMVDESDKFSKVFKDFQKWLLETKLINDNQAPISRFTFITCGDWDLQKILPNQCRICNYEIPPYMKSWINVKKSFVDYTDEWPRSQSSMLNHLGIQPIGRAHSGIDDCHNLAQIVRCLATNGYIFHNNSRLKLK